MRGKNKSHLISDPVAKKVMTTLFSKFEQENPAIKINNEVRPNSGDTYQPAVRTAFASSAPPDIATDIAGPKVYNLANAGVLRDLTSFYNEQIQPRALAGADTGSTDRKGRPYSTSDWLATPV